MCWPSLRYFQVIGKGRRGSNHTLHLWSTCRSSARGTCKACRICSGQQICQTVTSCILVYNPGISGMAHVIQTTSQMSNTNRCHGNSNPGNKRVLYRNTCFHKKCVHTYNVQSVPRTSGIPHSRQPDAPDMSRAEPQQRPWRAALMRGHPPLGACRMARARIGTQCHLRLGAC